MNRELNFPILNYFYVGANNYLPLFMDSIVISKGE